MARQIDQKLHDLWRRRIARQRRGSLSVAAFCEQEHVSTASFYAWKRKLDGRGSSQTAAVTRPPSARSTSAAGTTVSRKTGSPFVQVPLAAAPASPWIEIVLAEGAVVRLPQQNLAALQTVLQSLNGVTSSMVEVRRA